MLAVGSGLYRYANLHEEVPDGMNPFAKIKHFDEHLRERFLDHSEYARIDQVLTTLEHEQAYSAYGIAAIRVLILTGARRSEIEMLRWDSIDFSARKIRLSDSKSGPRIIEIPAGVLEDSSHSEIHWRRVCVSWTSWRQNPPVLDLERSETKDRTHRRQAA